MIMTEQKIEKFWRDATAEDVARVMNGETVEARVRDKSNENWKPSRLMGFYDTKPYSWLTIDGAFAQCQVYDPPQWFKNKPDPGEGWRLLGKFPDEPKLETDEFWSVRDATWRRTATSGETQSDCAWYRRRIEPEKVESRSKDYIPSGWIKVPNDEPRLASDAYWSQGAKDWIIIGDARVEYANRDKWPAIRQVKTHKSLQLVAGYRYRLPSGASIIATKNGFEVF